MVDQGTWRLLRAIQQAVQFRPFFLAGNVQLSARGPEGRYRRATWQRYEGPRALSRIPGRQICRPFPAPLEKHRRRPEDSVILPHFDGQAV